MADLLQRRLNGINLKGLSSTERLLAVIRFQPNGDGSFALSETEAKNEIVKFARNVDLAELIICRERPTRHVTLAEFWDSLGGSIDL